MPRPLFCLPGKKKLKDKGKLDRVKMYISVIQRTARPGFHSEFLHLFDEWLVQNGELDFRDYFQQQWVKLHRNWSRATVPFLCATDNCTVESAHNVIKRDLGHHAKLAGRLIQQLAKWVGQLRICQCLCTVCPVQFVVRTDFFRR